MAITVAAKVRRQGTDQPPSAEGSEATSDHAARREAGGVVPRLPLIERLGAAARMTVVSGPPGSGKTVLLRSWIAELADLLTGGRGGERALQALEQANVFVISLDVSRSWFRYHQMFAKLLQLELRRTAPYEVAALHRLAADWLAEHGQWVEAIRHALEELGAAEHLASQLQGSQALARLVTGLLLATQARAGLAGEARAALGALDDEAAGTGEIGNARAAICLAEGNAAAALAAVADVLDGRAPVIGYRTRRLRTPSLVETHLLAGLAHRALGDQSAANQATEQALALAESDRLVLPFAMTSSAELLESLPQHQTAHAALLADILDVLHGSSPAAVEQSSLPQAEELSPSELKVLRYLPTNLSRPEIAVELSVSRTRSARTCATSTPSSRSETVPRPCGAQGICGSWPFVVRGSQPVTWSTPTASDACSHSVQTSPMTPPSVATLERLPLTITGWFS